MDTETTGCYHDDSSLKEMHRLWKEQGRVAEGEEARRGLEQEVNAWQSLEEDRRLVREVRQGDESAFTTLMRKHWRPVHALCRRWLGDYVAANVNLEPEDAALETFVKLWRALPNLPDDVNVPAYLHVTATTTCISELRKRGVRSELVGESLDEVVYDSEGHPMLRLEYSRLLPSSPSSEQEAVWRDVQSTVQRLIAQLPERQRAVLVLSVQGLSPEEIGAILNMPVVETVRSNLRHARAQLREWLVAEGILPPDTKGGDTA